MKLNWIISTMLLTSLGLGLRSMPLSKAQASDQKPQASANADMETRVRALETEAQEHLDKLALSPPVGTVIAFAGPTDNVPAKWRLCNGDWVDVAELRNGTWSDVGEFHELRRSIGEYWGERIDERGERRVQQIRLPDLQGRFLRGADNSTNRDRDILTRVPSNPKIANGNSQVGSIQEAAMQDHTHLDSGHIHPFTTDLGGGHSHPVDIARTSVLGTNNTRDADGGHDKINGDPGLGSITASIPANAGQHTHSGKTNVASAVLGGPSDHMAGPPSVGNETHPANAYVNWIIKVSN